VLFASWRSHREFPGFFQLGSFLAAAVLVQNLRTQLRVSASGSIAFVVHLTTGILFGGFWASIVSVLSTFLNQVRRTPPIKLIFNASQRVLSLAGSLLIYSWLGGGIPPEYLKLTEGISATAVQWDIVLFFVFAVLYFLVNSVLVSAVVAISSGRRFREIWNLNTRGVLGYDLGASAIALVVAWFYVRAQVWVPFNLGPASLVAVVIPVVVLRHIYGMYHRLQETGRELLEVMVKAMEARDPYTSGHSIRVSTLSGAIANEMGLPTKQVEDIRTAGLLHDVGKIHEEFAPLLRKEDKLTEKEFALLQTHSARGAELVGIISSFRGSIQNMVRNHHERWDGAGYPDGLFDVDIPLGSRIIMISDTIDAMTTDRPYRKALSIDVVIAELQRCKATQFDPKLVDLVISSLAVRRLISDLSGQQPTSVAEPVTSPGKSKRVIWNAPRAWKRREG